MKTRIESNRIVRNMSSKLIISIATEIIITKDVYMKKKR